MLKNCKNFKEEIVIDFQGISGYNLVRIALQMELSVKC